MSYDPIINYYDKPGGPSIPGSDSGSGGGDHGGGGGGEGGYSYEAITTDLVHEQTINVVAGTGDQEGMYFSPITVDTQACAGIATTEDRADAVCVIDGTEYAARMYAFEGQDGVVSYSFEMDAVNIAPDSHGNYVFNVHDVSTIPLGNHVVRVYYEDANVTLKKPFIDAIEDAIADSGIGSLIVNMTPDSEDYNKWTLDKNCFEIWNAYISGKRVIFVNTNDVYNGIPIAMDNVTYMSRPSWSVEQFSFELFEVTSSYGNDVLRRMTYIVQSNTMTRTIEDYTLTPASNGGGVG
jgi:hypothetical protein